MLVLSVSPSPWRVFLGSPACISPVSRLYLTASSVSPVYPCIDLYLAILQQIHGIPLCMLYAVSRCIQLYSCIRSIRTYLAVSSCILLYLTESHHLKDGIWLKMYFKNYFRGLGRVSVGVGGVECCMCGGCVKGCGCGGCVVVVVVFFLLEFGGVKPNE